MDDGFIGGNKKLLIELVLVSMVIYTINSLIDLIKEKNVLTFRQRYSISFQNSLFTSYEAAGELF